MLRYLLPDGRAVLVRWRVCSSRPHNSSAGSHLTSSRDSGHCGDLLRLRRCRPLRVSFRGAGLCFGLMCSLTPAAHNKPNSKAESQDQDQRKQLVAADLEQNEVDLNLAAVQQDEDKDVKA
jgi:hypothetical protein